MANEDKQLILVEVRGRVALLTLNRPEAMNALNSALMIELMAKLEQLDADEGIGAFVINGDERAFAAGADIKEMAEASSVELLLRGHISPFARRHPRRRRHAARDACWGQGAGHGDGAQQSHPHRRRCVAQRPGQ